MFASTSDMKWSIPKHPRRGFSLIEVMVVVAIIGFIAAIGVANIIRSRDKAQKETCIANLRQVNSALQQWAVQNNKGSSDTVVMSDLTPFLDKDKTPACPGGGTYTVTTVGANPECSLSSDGHSF